MTECKRIQEMLSPFLEGVLSPDEKRLVHEHLAECQICNAALEDLKKAAQLIQGLDEVEPPPWFTQRVMGKVREDAERKKKDLFSRLFCPLHVKVPMQAVASILIVVLVLYVYRSMEPEMKVARAPSEVAPREVVPPKDELQRQYDKEGAGTPTAKNEPLAGQRSEKAGGTISEAPRVEAAKEPKKEETPPPAATSARSARVEKKGAVADWQKQKMRAAAPSPGQEEVLQMQKAPPSVLERQEAESRVSPTNGARMKEAPGGALLQTEPKAKQFSAKKTELTDFTLRVNNVTAAAGEIREFLTQLGARNIEAVSHNGAAVITAELAVEKTEQLLKKLSDLGQVDKKGPRPVTTEGTLSIRIEITS